MLAFTNTTYATEFYAGWLTEYSLSVDNLFVFVIIMARFQVPRKFQQEALMIGIIIALVLRGIFILLGAVVIERFVWVFYIFGAFLIYTAINLVRHRGEDEDYEENAFIRRMRKVLPITQDYHGAKIRVSENGKKMWTPMIVVILALGTTDLIFALDSIPAIFGLTREPFIVFTANVFALMGLRQLYFLLGGLLKRLVYLSLGLAVILAFIGVKLIMEACTRTSCRSPASASPSRASPRSRSGCRCRSSWACWSSPRWPACSRPAASSSTPTSRPSTPETRESVPPAARRRPPRRRPRIADEQDEDRARR